MSAKEQIQTNCRGSAESAGQKTTVSVNQGNIELAQDRFTLSRLDYFLALVVAALAGLYLFPYLGTSVIWDDMLYLNLSQHTTQEVRYLNRYGHIYILKLFLAITGDVITGGKICWCFMYSATCVLVYWCAKLLAGKKGVMIGLIALLFFCAEPILIKYVGCILAEFTIMFLSMLGIFVYLVFIFGKHKHRHLFIMILGLIFFWAVKSKESSICMGILFLGLGKNEQGIWNISRFAKDMGRVCLGMIIGFLLLAVLDQIFLKDALFSVRPSNIEQLFEFNLKERNRFNLTSSWYAILCLSPSLTAFLLYLLVGFSLPLSSNLSRHKIVMWLIPLVLMVFMIIITMKGSLRSRPRYYIIPAIPVISIWAAQFFRFDLNGHLFLKKNNRTIYRGVASAALVLLAFIAVLAIMRYIASPIKNTGWESWDQFYTCIILPMSTTVLLISAIIMRRRGLMALFLALVCLFLVVYQPLVNNLTLLRDRVAAKRSELRFEPYRVFADELKFNKNMKILISKDIHKRSWMLGREVESQCWLFNVFFNQKFDYDQFVDGSWEDILKGDYTYGFLTGRDLKGISQKYDIEHLLKNYKLKTDKKAVYRTSSGTMQLVLLKQR